jgi:hypothetical protein
MIKDIWERKKKTCKIYDNKKNKNYFFVHICVDLSERLRSILKAVFLGASAEYQIMC